MKLSLSCEQTAALLSDHAEGILNPPQRWRVEHHLSRCAACRALDATLRAVPRLAAELLTEPAPPAPAEARAALQGALARLGQGRLRPLPEARPMPAALQQARTEDAPLRLLDLAHRTLMSVLPRETTPLLPEEVASQLPDPATWRWAEHRGLRRTELMRDAVSGARLSLLFAPAGYQIPRHRHRGTESLLLLDGEMADARGCYATGDVIHMEDGSAHAPVMGEEGCWCLVRETGDYRFEGPFGWLRHWLAA